MPRSASRADRILRWGAWITAAGLLFTLKGWTLMNELAIPLVLFAGASITWLAWKRRGEPKHT